MNVLDKVSFYNRNVFVNLPMIKILIYSDPLNLFSVKHRCKGNKK